MCLLLRLLVDYVPYLLKLHSSYRPEIGYIHGEQHIEHTPTYGFIVFAVHLSRPSKSLAIAFLSLSRPFWY